MPCISIAQSDADLLKCFPVMAELRPHLTKPEDFISRVRRQQRQHGYQIVFLQDEGAVRALGGFRIMEFLAWGQALYVDDLVTTEKARGHGYGQQLMDWLLNHARNEKCQEFHLDSGVHRFEAHGFYLKNRLHIKSHHFSRTLT